MKRAIAIIAVCGLAQIATADNLPLFGAGAGAGINTVTPVFQGAQSNTSQPSTSVVNYAGPGNNWSGTELAREWPMPITGTVESLTASFQTALTGAQTYIIKFLDVTASTSIGGANCTLNSSSQYCNDTTDAPLSVAAGDLVTISADPNSTTPAAQTVSTSVSYLLTNTSGQSAIFSGSITVSASAQNYQGFTTPKVSATEINVSSIVPGPTAGSSVGTLSNLYAHDATGTPTANKGYAVLLYKNGVVTAQGGGSTCETAVAAGTQATILTSCTCVIYSAAVNCNNASSSDAAVTINAGDTISIETYPYGTPSAAAITSAMACTPVTSTNTMAFSNAVTLPTGISVKYAPVSGFGSNTATEAQTNNAAPAAMHVLDLWAAIDTVAPSGDTRTQTLRGGASGSVGNTSLTCGIGNAASGITIGGVANSPACNDLTAGHSFSSGSPASTAQYFDIVTSQNAGTTSIAAWYKTSAVMTVP